MFTVSHRILPQPGSIPASSRPNHSQTNGAARESVAFHETTAHGEHIGRASEPPCGGKSPTRFAQTGRTSPADGAKGDGDGARAGRAPDVASDENRNVADPQSDRT